MAIAGPILHHEHICEGIGGLVGLEDYNLQCHAALMSKYLQQHACGESPGPGRSRQTSKMGQDHTFE